MNQWITAFKKSNLVSPTTLAGILGGVAKILSNQHTLDYKVIGQAFAFVILGFFAGAVQPPPPPESKP